MRTAVIQLGPDFPDLQDQLDCLRPLAPDVFHVEETATAQSARRILERLEHQGEGDEVCLFSLSTLRLDVGDVVRLLMDLSVRGAACLVASGDDAPVRIDTRTEAGPIMRLLADLQCERMSGRRPAGGLPPEDARRLLRPEEIEEIRRLARAGVSARRIGLAYGRTPDCIRALLRQTPAARTPVSARSHRNTNLRQSALR